MFTCEFVMKICSFWRCIVAYRWVLYCWLSSEQHWLLNIIMSDSDDGEALELFENIDHKAEEEQEDEERPHHSSERKRLKKHHKDKKKKKKRHIEY